MLAFANNSPTKIWVAIMFLSHDTCGQYGNWQTMGWWGIEPGQTVDVYDNNLDDLNQFFYYYAKSADGRQWSGNFGPVYVYHTAFNSCVNIGSTAAYATVGMRQIDVNGFDDYTKTLHL